MKKIHFELREGEEFIPLIQLLKAASVVENGSQAQAAVEAGIVYRNGNIEYRKRAKIRKGENIRIENCTILVAWNAVRTLSGFFPKKVSLASQRPLRQFYLILRQQTSPTGKAHLLRHPTDAMSKGEPLTGFPSVIRFFFEELSEVIPEETLSFHSLSSGERTYDKNKKKNLHGKIQNTEIPKKIAKIRPINGYL